MMSQQHYRLIWFVGQACLAAAVGLLPVSMPSSILVSACLSSLISIRMLQVSYSPVLIHKVRERELATLVSIVGFILFELGLLLLLILWSYRVQTGHFAIRSAFVLTANALTLGVMRLSLLLAKRGA